MFFSFYLDVPPCSALAMVTVCPQEGPGVTSLIASTVFNFVDREAVLEESSPVSCHIM